MKKFFKKALVILLVLLIAAGMILSMMPLPASAATRSEFSSLEVSGWIPYWRATEGAHDARKNIKKLDVVHPFAYTVKSDGTLNDLANLSGSAWKKLFSAARKEKVPVVPTIMTSNTELVHSTLSNPTLRAAHVKAIVATVKKGKFDGIDIDYEGKRAATKDYFSLFLKDLKKALGKKMLSCTIEARTPPDSLYRTVPVVLEFANDLAAINRYCDRVNVMAYDQQRADLKVNDANKGKPYIPVADPAWIEKVIDHMAKDIDRDKMVLGIATYGVEWELRVSPQWYENYGKLWSFGINYAVDLADDMGIEPYRTTSGELAFTYIPAGTVIPNSYKAPKGTPEGLEAAERALAFANATGKTVLVNIAWWGDAKAARDKVALAKEKGLAGVAFFRIDGGEDKDIWKLF